MTLIFPGVLVVFTISSFDFHQVTLPCLNCKWWVAPNLSNLKWLDYLLLGNARITTSCNGSQRHFYSLKMHLSWLGLPYRRKTWTTV